jgi:hypothetical protein
MNLARLERAALLPQKQIRIRHNRKRKEKEKSADYIIERDEGSGNDGRARHDFDCAARCDPWVTCHGIWHIASTIFADPIHISTHCGTSAPAAQLRNALCPACKGRCSFHKQTGPSQG